MKKVLMILGGVFVVLVALAVVGITIAAVKGTMSRLVLLHDGAILSAKPNPDPLVKFWHAHRVAMVLVPDQLVV